MGRGLGEDLPVHFHAYKSHLYLCLVQGTSAPGAKKRKTCARRQLPALRSKKQMANTQCCRGTVPRLKGGGSGRARFGEGRPGLG